MDTSETYIKMCEKAEKIQEYHREKRSQDGYNECDTYAYLKGGIGGVNIRRVVERHCFRAGIDFLILLHGIWLPTQSNLQEMVLELYDKQLPPNVVMLSCEQLRRLSEKFLRFVEKQKYFNSMEQLWLAFLLSVKYNKVWDGNDWILKK